MFSLRNKIALVTGAGSGIGASIAQTLAQAGAVAWVVDRDAGGAAATVEQIRGAGGQAEALTADARRALAVEPPRRAKAGEPATAAAGRKAKS